MPSAVAGMPTATEVIEKLTRVPRRAMSAKADLAKRVTVKVAKGTITTREKVVGEDGTVLLDGNGSPLYDDIVHEVGDELEMSKSEAIEKRALGLVAFEE